MGSRGILIPLLGILNSGEWGLLKKKNTVQNWSYGGIQNLGDKGENVLRVDPFKDVGGGGGIMPI